MMIPVLAAALGLETAVALLLISKVPPLEKLACMCLDLTKTQKGSAAVKTLALTFLIFMASSVSTYVSTQRHLYLAHKNHDGHGGIAQTEIFVLRTAELETALTGFIMLLAVMINRTHYYLRGKRGLTTQLEVLKKQSKAAQTEYLRLKEERNDEAANTEAAKEVKSLKEIIAELRGKVEKAQKEGGQKEKEAKAAEANAQAIRKQTEGRAMEYERLMADNENLRSQLSVFDKEHSRSGRKKDS